jgi:hypothetical protein
VLPLEPKPDPAVENPDDTGKVTKKPKDSGTTTTGGGNTLNFSYGVYTGSIKNGKANGMGELKYTVARQIHPDDPQKRIAQPGDRVSGVFENNLPTTVRWYDKNGELKESIIVGSTGLQEPSEP